MSSLLFAVLYRQNYLPKIRNPIQMLPSPWLSIVLDYDDDAIVLDQGGNRVFSRDIDKNN